MMPKLQAARDRLTCHSLDRLVRRQFEGVTLYNADWKDALPDVVCDAIITDQPYGTGWNVGGGGDKANDFKASRMKKVKPEWDELDLAWMDYAPATLAAFCPIKGDGIWKMCQRLKTPVVLKYRKTNPMPFGAACEPIVASRPIAGVWEKEAYNGDNALHPCQKPVNLMAWLVMGLTEAGQTVCDPFMGSASTAIACIRTGRKFVGIEKDVKHFETACERVANELAQGVLLPPNIYSAK